jgi:hypothetical protein
MDEVYAGIVVDTEQLGCRTKCAIARRSMSAMDGGRPAVSEV